MRWPPADTRIFITPGMGGEKVTLVTFRLIPSSHVWPGLALIGPWRLNPGLWLDDTDPHVESRIVVFMARYIVSQWILWMLQFNSSETFYTWFHDIWLLRESNFSDTNQSSINQEFNGINLDPWSEFKMSKFNCIDNSFLISSLLILINLDIFTTIDDWTYFTQ